MDGDFDVAMRLVLKSEGGYCNVKGDPGGPTNMGVTIFDYRKYLKANATADDVKTLTLAQALQIYRMHYWNPLRCPELPPGLDYGVVDYGINSGTARPYRVLQTLFKLPVTGRADDATLKALEKMDPAKVLNALCDERLHFMQGIKGGAAWKQFGGGWGTRVASVRKVGMQMIKAGSTTAVAPIANNITTADAAAAPKATHVDPKLAQKVGTGTITTAAVPAAGGGASHEILIAIGGVVAVVVVGGAIYYVIHKRQTAKQDAVILPANLASVNLAAAA